MTNDSSKQREAWLHAATVEIAQHWAKQSVTVPADVHVSCGVPGGGSPRKRIGECWPRSRSKGNVNEVFINPVLSKSLEVLDVLGHELIHAVDDCQSGHGKMFTKISKTVGYTGGKHSAAKAEMVAFFTTLVAQLGEYPHAATILKTKSQKENTGLHKFACPEHGDVLYSTAKMVSEYGMPRCRHCGEEMLPHDRQVKKIIQTV